MERWISHRIDATGEDDAAEAITTTEASTPVKQEKKLGS